MDVQLRPGHERRRDDERSRRREVTRHLDVAQLQPFRGAYGDAVLAPCDRGPGRLEHELGVVARRHGLDDGRLAVGVEAREEDRRFHLSARDRELVGDPVQRPPLDTHRQVPLLRLDTGAHARERLGDPPHRPCAERPVAGELELLPFLPCEDPREEPDERARVAAVDRTTRCLQPAQPLPEDVEGVVSVLVDGDPERADGRDRRLGVGGAAEVRDARLAVADGAEEHRAVRDRLVAGHGEVPDETRDRVDPHSPITGATTTP